MELGIDPKVDYAFKRVFGDQRNADILIHLINAILQRQDPVVSVDILNPFNDKDFSEDKLTVLDIKARDQVGNLFNVEMQLLLPQHFRSRVLYYWAALYRQQLQEGESYSRLRPTISICLINHKLFREVDDYCLDFRLVNQEHLLCFSEHLQLYVLELPKFQRQLSELRGPLEKWMYIFRHGATFDADHLPAEFSEPVYQHAFKELKMLTQDDLERERYESRQKAIRDQISLLEGAREQGIKKGRKEGQLIGRIQLCEQLLNRPSTTHEHLAALSLEELRERADALQSELSGS